MIKKYSVKIIPILFFLFLSALYAGPDDYSLSVVKLEKFSDKVLSESVSKYRLKSSDSEFSLPETPYQSILKREKYGNNFTLELICGKTAGKNSAGNADNLTATRFLDYNEPEIRTLTARFKKSADAVKDVENFVYGHVSNKKMGIPLLPASDILKSRTGDCTEHAVLSAAILRSLGIPARAAVGMLLSQEFGQYRNVFVYHMWVEAFLNGKWILVDATRPGGKSPNLYIAFAYHHLKTEMPLDFLKAVSAMKNFTVEYAGGN
jgi:transglutaminase-like putative cysteine protease